MNNNRDTIRHPSDTIYLFGGLNILVGIMSFFGIFMEVDRPAAFSSFIFAGISFILGFMLKKQLSLIILIIYFLFVIMETAYLWYLDYKFTPVPVLVCFVIIYLVLQDYKSVKKLNDFP